VASGMIGMRRCLECGCKVWYVQMSPDVVCVLELSIYHYLHLLMNEFLKRVVCIWGRVKLCALGLSCMV